MKVNTKKSARYAMSGAPRSGVIVNPGGSFQIATAAGGNAMMAGPPIKAVGAYGAPGSGGTVYAPWRGGSGPTTRTAPPPAVESPPPPMAGKWREGKVSPDAPTTIKTGGPVKVVVSAPPGGTVVKAREVAPRQPFAFDPQKIEAWAAKIDTDQQRQDAQLDQLTSAINTLAQQISDLRATLEDARSAAVEAKSTAQQASGDVNTLADNVSSHLVDINSQLQAQAEAVQTLMSGVVSSFTPRTVTIPKSKAKVVRTRKASAGSRTAVVEAPVVRVAPPEVQDATSDQYQPQDADFYVSDDGRGY